MGMPCEPGAPISARIITMAFGAVRLRVVRWLLVLRDARLRVGRWADPGWSSGDLADSILAAYLTMVSRYARGAATVPK